MWHINVRWWGSEAWLSLQPACINQAVSAFRICPIFLKHPWACLSIILPLCVLDRVEFPCYTMCNRACPFPVHLCCFCLQENLLFSALSGRCSLCNSICSLYLMLCGRMVLLEKEMLFRVWKVGWICSSCLCLCLCCFYWSTCFLLQVPGWYQLLPKGGRMLGMGASGLEINFKGQMKATSMNFSVCNVLVDCQRGNWDPKRALILRQKVLSKRQRQKRSQQTPDSPSHLNLFPFSVAGEDCPRAFIVSAAHSDVSCVALKPRTRGVSQLYRRSGLVVVFWGGGQRRFCVELPSCWGDSPWQATFAGGIAQSAAHHGWESSVIQLTLCPHRSYTSVFFVWVESQKICGPGDGFLTFFVVVNFWKFRLWFICSDVYISVPELLILNSFCCWWREWASADVLLDRPILNICIHLRGRTLPTAVSFFCLQKQSGLSTEMYTSSHWPCS